MRCEHSDNGRYILVTFNRPMTAELERQLCKDIVAFSDKHQVRKFLFDMTKAINIDNVFGNYQFATRDIF